MSIAFGVLLGCSGGPMSAPVDTTAATDSVEQLVAITTAMANADGASGLAAGTKLVTDGETIFSASNLTAGIPQGANVSASCSSTSCVFDVGFSQYPEVFGFSGSATLDGSQLSLQLQRSSGHSSELEATWTVDGTLNMTGSTINGTLKVSGDITGNFPVPGTTTTTIEYQHIAVDATACPIGGSLRAASIASSTPPASATQTEDIVGTAVFGPACGDVR